MIAYTSEQVLSFAPDFATGRKGEELATIRKWRHLEGNPKLIWGECISSGATYYKTQIDLTAPAFKCNCPSRKFPCKHALGLFLMYVNNSESFRISSDYPEWVREWVEKRGIDESPDKATQEAEALKKKEAKAKNRDARINLMASGVADLELWLQDMIRQGLAASEGQSYAYWQGIAARMVDSKLGGVGRRIRKFPLLHASDREWHVQMLSEMAQLYMIVKGFENLEELPPVLQQELLSVAGVNTKKDTLLSLKGVYDDWLVMGVTEGIDENLNFRHTWMYGSKTEKTALILEYSFGDRGYDNTWRTGQAFNGELVYYPSTYQMRALVKSQKNQVGVFEAPRGFHYLERFFEYYTKAIAKNPWIYDFPCYLESVIPTMEKDRLYIIDEQKHYIEAYIEEALQWKLIGLSGGHPINIFGEWSGELFRPVSILVNGGVIAL